MKKRVLAVALAVAMVAAVAGVFSTGVSAQEETWSVAVHLEYADGTTYDIVIARGLTNERKASMLADCGRSHRQGTVVRYHCYPIPE
jgi:hypothetical protein